MGTRHLICVVNDNQYRIAQYGQWDGYPSGQGIKILDFLKSPMIEQLKNNLDNCSWLTAGEHNKLWEGFGVDANQSYVDYDIHKEFCSKYPQLNRDTGAGILNIVANATGSIKLKDDLDFAQVSLFCEWVYVIDFDKNTLEVYRGFNETPLEPSDRFYTTDQKEDENGLYPVKLFQSFDLSNLPSENEFLEICEQELDEKQTPSFDGLIGM